MNAKKEREERGSQMRQEKEETGGIEGGRGTKREEKTGSRGRERAAVGTCGPGVLTCDPHKMMLGGLSLDLA